MKARVISLVKTTRFSKATEPRIEKTSQAPEKSLVKTNQK
jgi:hypothetical protein